MKKHNFHPVKGLFNRGFYSHTIRAGNTVYTAGQVARDTNGRLVGGDDFQAQYEKVFENMEIALKSDGASLSDVVNINYYFTSMAQHHSIGMARLHFLEDLMAKYFGTEAPPCGTLAVVKNLSRPEYLVEASAIAIVGEKQNFHPVKGLCDRRFHTHTIRAGNTVYLAGQVGREVNGRTVGDEDFRAQSDKTFENMEIALKASGASLSDVVNVEVYFTSMAQLPVVEDFMNKYFGTEAPPCASFIGAHLSRPEYLLEITAIAVVGDKQNFHPVKGLFDRGFYSHTIRAGNTVYTAGQVGRDTDGRVIGGENFRAQSDKVFENLEIALKAGGASLSDVVNVNIYFTSMAQLLVVEDFMTKYFGIEAPPCATGVVVNHLSRPEYLLEISAIAIVDD